MTDEFDYGVESAEDQRMGEWLQAATPVPAAGFRGALNRYLRRRDPGYGPRPPRLRLISAACAGGGVVLLAVAALQTSGSM
jgi:hypothetical protein